VGILWRLLAPKSVKRARRTVRRAAHPVRTASWALSPKPVKKARRAAFKVAHPGAALELAVSDQVVNSLRGGARSRRKPVPGKPAKPAGSRTRGQRAGVTWLPGTTEIPVAGVSHHAEAVGDSLRDVPDGGQLDAWLVAEPKNAHDANAVAVYLRGGQAGYLPRPKAAVLQPALAALSAAHGGRPASCPARVDLGGYQPEIVLMIDLSELGVDPAALE
jgi:hypothetical protein